MSVLIETTLGDIVIDLYVNERERTCENFLKLCKIKFYNFCTFHYVKRNFIAQTGDPTGRGTGGESIFASLYGAQATYFEGEKKPRLKHARAGTVSMVNQNSIASQFFITLGNDLTYLDDNHTVFGEIVEGSELVEKLNDALVDDNSRPYQDIRICHTIILEDPFDDPNGMCIPSRSPSPNRDVLESDRMCLDEELADEKALTAEELDEEFREKEARAQATVLEMIGDLPSVDVKPPENVLFVCKLNPATCSEDLHIIFSRFGVILSCEVIRDWKTGNSLQYAFIEFDLKEDCEKAYFKMDNVLIDDRRIHVDFSQSVSKMRWQAFLKQRKIFKKGEKSQKLASALSDDEDNQNDSAKQFTKSSESMDSYRHKNEEDQKTRRHHRSPVPSRSRESAYRTDDHSRRNRKQERNSSRDRKEKRDRDQKRERELENSEKHRRRPSSSEKICYERSYRPSEKKRSRPRDNKRKDKSHEKK